MKTTRRVTDYIFETFSQQMVYIFAPVVKNRKGVYKALFEKYIKRGFLKALIDGRVHYLDDVPPLNRNITHHIAILVDAVKISPGNQKQVEESVSLADERPPPR